MDIERLTARNKDGIAYLVNVKPDEQEVDSPHKNTLKCILDCFERLAQYEEQAALRQYQKPTDEAVQRAIYWQEHIKKYHQDKWKHAEPEWRAEPGAQSQQDELMASFDLAIQALRQMRTEPDCSTAEWQGGYCLGYGKSDTDDKCEWCDKTLTLFTNSGKFIPENQPPRNYCTNCGRKLVKHDG